MASLIQSPLFLFTTLVLTTAALAPAEVAARGYGFPTPFSDSDNPYETDDRGEITRIADQAGTFAGFNCKGQPSLSKLTQSNDPLSGGAARWGCYQGTASPTFLQLCQQAKGFSHCDQKTGLILCSKKVVVSAQPSTPSVPGEMREVTAEITAGDCLNSTILFQRPWMK